MEHLPQVGDVISSDRFAEILPVDPTRNSAQFVVIEVKTSDTGIHVTAQRLNDEYKFDPTTEAIAFWLENAYAGRQNVPLYAINHIAHWQMRVIPADAQILAARDDWYTPDI